MYILKYCISVNPKQGYVYHILVKDCGVAWLVLKHCRISGKKKSLCVTDLYYNYSYNDQ